MLRVFGAEGEEEEESEEVAAEKALKEILERSKLEADAEIQEMDETQAIVDKASHLLCHLVCVCERACVRLCLLFYILATYKVISGPLVHTRGDFIVQPYWETRPPALCPVALSHNILS